MTKEPELAAVIWQPIILNLYYLDCSQLLVTLWYYEQTYCVLQAGLFLTSWNVGPSFQSASPNPVRRLTELLLGQSFGY